MKTYGHLEMLFPSRSDWTLGHILSERAESHAHKPFLTMSGSPDLSFGMTADLVSRTAHGLQSDGLVDGERVAILAETRMEYVIAWFAATWAGLIEVPISPYYRGQGLRHLIETVEPAAAICEPRLTAELLDSGATGMLRRVYLLAGPGREEARTRLSAAGLSVADFEALYEATPTDARPRRPHDLASVLFTSGTTGLPKGVKMPEAQLYFFSEQFRNYERITDADIYLHDKPMYTALAHFHVMYSTLVAGASVAMYEGFSAGQWAQRVHDSGATVVLLLGEMMDFVMKQEPNAVDHDNQLRCISCGPTSWAVVDDFVQRFGGEAVAEAYGQTEISCPIMTPYGSDRPKGSCGLAVDEWFDIRLADAETDESVEDGELGELQIRTRVPWTICDGYYAAPEATAAARRNLWFHTGDMFRRDSEGWFYFVDRARDVIRRRGRNIASKEIEDAFLQRDDVLECAAVNIPPAASDESDEILVALVVTDPCASEEEMVRFVESELPYYAVPRYIRRVSSLPLTPTGKVRKVELRQMRFEGGVWDRTAAGVVLAEEAVRARKRHERSS